MNSSNDVAFLICTERPIESASVLLAQSIRDWGGSLADSPIYSFQPRPGFEISSWVQDCFKSLHVEHITEPLNRKYSDYPQGNKPLVGAYAESRLPYDKFIFCDSDKLVVNDLSTGFDLGANDIAVRPVHGKSKVGYASKTDPAFKYWEGLWQELGIEEPEIRVTTTVAQEDIFGYWNSGLVIVKRDSGILGEWERLFKLVNEKPIEPAAGTFFLDQIVLAATLHMRPTKVQELPLGYNYPIHRHYFDEIPKTRTVNRTENLYTVHYHGLIRDPFFLNMFDGLEGDDCLKKWLREQVKRYKIHPHDLMMKRGYLQLKMTVYRYLKQYGLR